MPGIPKMHILFLSEYQHWPDPNLPKNIWRGKGVALEEKKKNPSQTIHINILMILIDDLNHFFIEKFYQIFLNIHLLWYFLVTQKTPRLPSD